MRRMRRETWREGEKVEEGEKGEAKEVEGVRVRRRRGGVIQGQSEISSTYYRGFHEDITEQVSQSAQL